MDRVILGQGNSWTGKFLDRVILGQGNSWTEQFLDVQEFPCLDR